MELHTHAASEINQSSYCEAIPKHASGVEAVCMRKKKRKPPCRKIVLRISRLDHLGKMLGLFSPSAEFFPDLRRWYPREAAKSIFVGHRLRHSQVALLRTRCVTNRTLFSVGKDLPDSQLERSCDCRCHNTPLAGRDSSSRGTQESQD